MPTPKLHECPTCATTFVDREAYVRHARACAAVHRPSQPEPVTREDLIPTPDRIPKRFDP